MENSKEKQQKVPKTLRTKTELFEDINEQINFLKNDCIQYDNGNISYYKKIALDLRILLYYTKNNKHTLLNQAKEMFVFNIPDFIDISTTHGSLPNLESSNFVRSSMCCYNLNHSIDSEPILYPESIKIENKKRYPYRAFKTWWENEVIILIDNKYSLTRETAIAFVADQDGGAHLDPKIGENLVLLKRKTANPLKIVIKTEGRPKTYVAKVDDVLGASIRSIAEETLYMFNTIIIPYCQKYLD